MGTWISTKSPKVGQKVAPCDQLGAPSPAIMTRITSAPRKGTVGETKLDLGSVDCLSGAFKAHAAAFDLDGNGTICVEELILIFDRCSLFDKFFTPNRVRNYFSTWAEGCNHSSRRAAPLDEDGIGFPEFEEVLRWAADMKGAPLSSCAQKVVSLSKRLCDSEASVQRKVEVVFDAFCKKTEHHMTAFEFGVLCRKLDLPLGMGDVIILFKDLPGGLRGEGVDFQGFVRMLAAVGRQLGLGEEIFPAVARGVGLVDTDVETLVRVKMRLKNAASVVGGSDWEGFFRACDTDQSGQIDWEEFLDTCRGKLHLADRDSHLRILFEKLDREGTGEFSIDDLIHFIGESGA